jgi:hypothetical protein
MESSNHLNSTPGVVGMPNLLLRMEALTLLVASAGIYQAEHGNWLLFTICFFLPDAAMLGYLHNPRIGAVCYNIAHTTTLYGIVGGLGYITNYPLALEIGLIGAAHIGFDRLLGYGLKYPEGFGLTHLGRVGKAAQ